MPAAQLLRRTGTTLVCVACSLSGPSWSQDPRPLSWSAWVTRADASNALTLPVVAAKQTAATARWVRLGGGCRHVGTDPVHDLGGRGTGGEDLRHPEFLEFRDVGVGNDAATEDQNIVDLAFPK